MRARICLGLASMVLAATAAVGQVRHPAPTPTPAAHPQKCAYGHRLVQSGACTAPKPWRCEPCPQGVRTLRILDKCGAPIQICKKP